MNDRPIDDHEMPPEIDFGKGVRGLHHIPAGAKVFLPVKAEQKGVALSELLTDVLKRDIEINEALK